MLCLVFNAFRYMKIICTFFACTKKVPKKYTEGLRALLTPGNAVKLRLRFAPQVLRRYWKFHSMWKRKNSQFVFTPYRHRANTSTFSGNFWFLLYWGWVLYLSFRACVYGTKTGLFSWKIKFVIFACSPAKVGAALCRLSDCGLTHRCFFNFRVLLYGVWF